MFLFCTPPPDFRTALVPIVSGFRWWRPVAMEFCHFEPIRLRPRPSLRVNVAPQGVQSSNLSRAGLRRLKARDFSASRLSGAPVEMTPIVGGAARL
jgi:hypothetical protein